MFELRIKVLINAANINSTANIVLLDTLFTCKNGAMRREKPLPRDSGVLGLHVYNLLSNEVMHKMMKAWKQKQYR